jgi:uncharacterized protein (DUF1778 family)
MDQINFRIDSEDGEIAKLLAESTGTTLADIARRAFLKEIRPKRVDLAFKILAEGKIGFKRAWKISGLEYREFLLEWAKRDAKEIIPDEYVIENINDSKKLDLSAYLKA